MRLNPDGTTTIEHGPPLPIQLPFDSALRIACWLSLVAFVIGFVLLLTSLVRVMAKKRASTV